MVIYWFYKFSSKVIKIDLNKILYHCFMLFLTQTVENGIAALQNRYV